MVHSLGSPVHFEVLGIGSVATGFAFRDTDVPASRKVADAIRHIYRSKPPAADGE